MDKMYDERLVTSAAAFDDGNCVAIGSNDGVVVIIDTRQHPREGGALFWKTPYVNSVEKLFFGRG